ncbi:MAG: hypothetical protein ACI90E_001704, partial [Yoonia sp.]
RGQAVRHDKTFEKFLLKYEACKFRECEW